MGRTKIGLRLWIPDKGTIAVGMTTWGKTNRKKILYHNTNGSVLDFGISKRIAPISGPDDKISLRFNIQEQCLYLKKVCYWHKYSYIHVTNILSPTLNLE